MPQKSRRPVRSIKKVNQHLVAGALRRRVVQRIGCRGTIRLPAVPALVDEYVTLCADVFSAAGRGFAAGELDAARQVLSQELTEAFAASPRSKIEICFEAQPSRPLAYQIKQDHRTIADAYEGWIGADDAPLFGAHPDARVMCLAKTLTEPSSSPILDFGAGTGRNALALARLGFPVDAVEITPKFAEMLRTAAADEGLAVRVIVDDVLRNGDRVARGYRMLLASEVIPDFRGVDELRLFLEFASTVLGEGGLLLFNVHRCARGFTPDKAARELSQQCYSCLFTPGELAQAAEGLPFQLIADDSVHDFEQEHLPRGAFPPTPWYVSWTTGLDVYEVDGAREKCPVEMRWLVFERCREPLAPGRTIDAVGSQATRAARFDTAALRRALARRLVRRMSTSGTLLLPAVPAMLDTYVEMCGALFGAIARPPDPDPMTAVRHQLQSALEAAFSTSQHSQVVFTYEAPFGEPLRYTATPDPVPPAEAYAEWYEGLGDALFGVRADARVETLVADVPEPGGFPVLDLGAGTGRNALYLARRGHPVDAVEVVPALAAALRAQVQAEPLPVRVIERDMLDCGHELRRDYRLVLLSGTAADLRETTPLRELFQMAADVLAEGGLFLLNLHLAVDGYRPDLMARQWAQFCRATFCLPDELDRATAGLPLVLLANESAHDYERAHLAEEEWPPTPVFAEWALGQHMYALEREQCPIELRWLLFRKTR